MDASSILTNQQDNNETESFLFAKLNSFINTNI